MEIDYRNGETKVEGIHELENPPDTVLKSLHDFLKNIPENTYLVVPFDNLPENVRYGLNFNGGDEDYVVAYKNEPTYSFTDYFRNNCGDPDHYRVTDNSGFYVYFHA
jgi:hypothetical protein